MHLKLDELLGVLWCCGFSVLLCPYCSASLGSIADLCEVNLAFIILSISPKTSLSSSLRDSRSFSRVCFRIRFSVSVDGEHAILGAAKPGKLLAFSRMWSNIFCSVKLLCLSSSTCRTGSSSMAVQVISEGRKNKWESQSLKIDLADLGRFFVGA
uniref:Secreted protein n=1 Tax=Cannabis sativa TaxID=3483 RepID=A0A803RB27_CANSA